jgi:hypothetical protein
VGGADAEFLEKEFMPEFTENDLVNLAKANVYIKLMIDGVASRPFSAETLPPDRPPLVSYRDVIIKNTRERYGTPRAIVDAKIAAEWETKGDTIIDEKIGRRGEQRLHDVLKSDARVERQKPRGHDDREVTSDENVPHVPTPKKEYPKSSASIEEMRRAINESLKKQSE